MTLSAHRQHARRDHETDLLGVLEIIRPWTCVRLPSARLTSVIHLLTEFMVIFIIGQIMGAIAVSKKEEEQIERLRKELGISSKSGVIRTALRVLEKKSQEENCGARSGIP
jgi:uncharacterized membrane protein